MKPVSDKAEVSIDFPDKFYIGNFERDSSFEARAEGDGLYFRLVRAGSDRREASIHLHHYVLAGILTEWAASLRQGEPVDRDHAKDLTDALKAVEKALARRK